jgi:methylase of polypeptide subunit release factors
LLGFEVGDGQGEEVARLCREAGLVDVCLHPDLAGRARVVTAVRTMPEKALPAEKKSLGKVRLSG